MSSENGYRNPPKKNQFKKGQSGNPKGRPRSSLSDNEQSFTLLKLIKEALVRKVDATEGGRRIKTPFVTVLINKMLYDALHGNAKAREQLLKLAEKADLAAIEGWGSEPLHIIVTGGLPGE